MTDGNQSALWLIADIDGANVRLGLATPSANPRIHEVRHYSTSASSTATGCFQQYAKDVGINLYGVNCAIAISGAVKGDVVRIARCNWIISVSGLTILFGTAPIILNDSVAKAWACIDLKSTEFRAISGSDSPALNQKGCWVSINFGDGVGAAGFVSYGHDHFELIDTECGHVGFAPENENEAALAQIVRRGSDRVSWEQILAPSADDVAWKDPRLSIAASDIAVFRAGLLGAFCGDVALALAGWSGTFLHGARAKLVLQPGCTTAFNQRFEAKTAFKSELRAMPRWLVMSDTVNLNGAARCLAARHFSSAGATR
jgi:glucokinase